MQNFTQRHRKTNRVSSIYSLSKFELHRKIGVVGVLWSQWLATIRWAHRLLFRALLFLHSQRFGICFTFWRLPIFILS